MKYHNNEVYILQDTLFNGHGTNCPYTTQFRAVKGSPYEIYQPPLSKNKFSKTIAIFGYIWYNEMSKF